MKLNYDCIRDVLLHLEQLDSIQISDDDAIYWSEASLTSICAALPNYSKEDIYYSLFNLEQAGYIDCSEIPASGCIVDYWVNYMTFDGHQFLDHIRADKRWQSIKGIASKIGDFSLKMLSAIAEGVGTAALNKLLSSNDYPIIGD